MKIIDMSHLNKKKKPVIFIVINFSSKDNNFMIADFTDQNKPKKIYGALFKSAEDLKENLLKAQELKAVGYVVMFREISSCDIFNEPFNYEKHFDKLYKVVKEVEESYIKNNPLKKVLKNLADEFKEIDTRKVFARLSEIIKEFFPELENLPESMQPVTDRDYLDLSIELYKLLYSRAYFMDYQSDDIDTATMEEPLINKLLEYKFNHYGHEIFGNYGFNIIDRLENGMIRIAPMTDEEIEVQSKLN